jgi:uncharacterized repeat protein (TIGR01451 family)
MPKVSIWQLDYDPRHATLAAGTHGRAAYTSNTGANSPALVVSKSDDGTPVGPGSEVRYTITVRNVGNAAATGVRIDEPVPARTSFVSASDGGALRNGTVQWRNLSVPAGGSTSVNLTVRISPNLPGSVTSIVNDGIVAKSAQGVDADLGAVAHGGEGGLDRVGGAQVDPVLEPEGAIR